MSASLVGSEMCIRDRHPPTPFPVVLLTTIHEVPNERLTSRINVSDAVSYTHLTLPTICSV
eukprot:4297464-Alexandrium_andersonii.AAC.1